VAVLIVAVVVARSVVMAAPAAQLVSAATAMVVLETQGFIAVIAVTTMTVSALIATNRRVVQEARVSAEKYRVLFEYFPVGVAITDDAGRVIETSRTADILLGVDSEEPLRRGLDPAAWGMVRRDGTPMPAEASPPAVALAGGVAVTDVEVGVQTGDRITWLDMTAAPIPIEGYGVAVAFSDVSRQVAEEEELAVLWDSLEHTVEDRTEELERVNAELREASAAKSRFLGNMSHELRTPLNSVIGFAGVMQGGLAGPLNEEQHRQISMIRRAGEHLLDLVNDVLDLTRIESGKETLHVTRFDVADLLAQVMEAASQLAAEKGLDLEMACEPADTGMLSDFGKARQVLINLVQNAVKFTENGSVSVQCARDGRMLVFRVTDTGIGIPADELDGIMGEFHQVDRFEDGMKPQGTGLGLAISTRLASLLGGEVTVESVVGEGSTFTFRVPAELGSVAFREPRT
jgi:signal transduction histidine kinase